MIKKIALFFIVAVLFFGSGFMTARVIYGKLKPIDPNNTRTAGWEAARERLFDLGIVQKDEMDAPTMELSGDIVKVESAAITVKIRPLEPLADPNLDSRLVRIGNNTGITQTTVKDAEQFQAEMNAYREKLGNDYDQLVNTDDFPPPPSSYTETDVTASALAVNQKVRITAGDNIRDQKEFTAETITILP